MWYQPSRRLLVGMVTALLVLGMSLSALSAGTWQTQVVTETGADGSRPGCCLGGEPGDTETDACQSACSAGAQAVLPSEMVTTVRCSGETGAGVQLFASARTVHPDPGPPRRFLLD